MRQHTLQMRGDSIAFSKPAFAISMAAKCPQIGPVINIKGDLATSVTGQLHCLETGGSNLFGAEMRTGDKHSPRRSDKPGINIIFANGHIGTVFTIKISGKDSALRIPRITSADSRAASVIM